MSDEGDAANDAANDAASDGTDTRDAQDDNHTNGGRTAVVTKTVTRPQRPTGKRTRQKLAEATDATEATEATEATDDSGATGAAAASKAGGKSSGKNGGAGGDAKSSAAKKAAKAKKAQQGNKAKKKPGARSANPITFIYNYLKQVVAEMRKVIWPNRRQMLTYTSVVLAFLAFMVTLVGLADFGLTKLVMLVFG